MRIHTHDGVFSRNVERARSAGSIISHYQGIACWRVLQNRTARAWPSRWHIYSRPPHGLLSFSATLHKVMKLMHPEQRPFTVACSVTLPFSGIVASAGETVTVTSGLPLPRRTPGPPAQPAMTINRANSAMRSGWRQCIRPPAKKLPSLFDRVPAHFRAQSFSFIHAK